VTASHVSSTLHCTSYNIYGFLLSTLIAYICLSFIYICIYVSTYISHLFYICMHCTYFVGMKKKERMKAEDEEMTGHQTYRNLARVCSCARINAHRAFCASNNTLCALRYLRTRSLFRCARTRARCLGIGAPFRAGQHKAHSAAQEAAADREHQDGLLVVATRARQNSASSLRGAF